MKIKGIDVYKLNIDFKHPVKVPLGVLSGARNMLIKITTDSGLFGWGEASPFSPITGDSQESCYVTAQQLALLIKGKNPLAIEARMAEINKHTVSEPSIRSAFDMALYDVLGKAANLPLYALLGGERRAIRTDLTVGMQDTVEQTVSRARNVLEQGFDAIKLKVGRQGLDDVEHVKAVRELVGPDVLIKIDSNQGWDYPTAVANLLAMKALGVQYSEQPIAAWDYDNLRRLRGKVEMPICADESVFDDKDALKLTAMGAVDYLNIKLGKSGGIHTALNINAIAQAAGCQCMIGCFAESRLGLTAAAHVVMARPNIHFLDLDSAYDLEEDPIIGGMAYDEKIGGGINLSDAPGLGVEVIDKYLDRESHISI